jgi:conjugal transfer/entry exclusion protein
MKRVSLYLLFSVVGVLSFAQIPVTITSNSDPGTILYYINEGQRYANTIENAIQMLQTADTSLQYQIQALQQLDSGTWQGFVNAWNDETVSINGYTSLVASLPSLSQIQTVADLVNSSDYTAALAGMRTLQTNWGYATNIVHSTDNLVKNTSNRQTLWAQAQAASAYANGPVAELQAVNQELGLIGGEVQDMNLNLQAWKDYFVAQNEQQQMQAKLRQQQADSFVQGVAIDNWQYQEGDWAQLESQ